MKVRTLENHQLPRSKAYLFTDSEIKHLFESISEICLFKSNHQFWFDKTYNCKAPKIKGVAVLTLAISKLDNSIFLHLYGCDKNILSKVTPNDLSDYLIPELNRWLKENLVLNEQWERHRMILAEVNGSSGDLKFHYIEG